MKLPLQISYQGLAHSDAIEAIVRKKADKLDRLCEDIMSCRVTVALVDRHQRQGKPYTATIVLTIPGHELVSSREQDEDVYVALREAFDGMTRMVEDATEKDRAAARAREANHA